MAFLSITKCPRTQTSCHSVKRPTIFQFTIHTQQTACGIRISQLVISNPLSCHLYRTIIVGIHFSSLCSHCLLEIRLPFTPSCLIALGTVLTQYHGSSRSQDNKYSHSATALRLQEFVSCMCGACSSRGLAIRKPINVSIILFC